MTAEVVRPVDEVRVEALAKLYVRNLEAMRISRRGRVGTSSAAYEAAHRVLDEALDELLATQP